MRLRVLSRLLRLCCAPILILHCANASTVVHIVDTVVPDLLPTFSSEAFTPRYIIALQHASTLDLGLEGVLPMKDKYGRPYSCVIPDAIQHAKEAQEASPLKDDEQTLQKEPSELLSALDSICLYRIEDWWTYELCYKKHVRQFHKDAENAISEYDLGQYDEDGSDLDTILDNGTLTGASSKYVRQVYIGGEACDITGKQRETEVHFVCSEEGKEGIKSIREHATWEAPVAGSEGVTIEGGTKRDARWQDEGALEGVINSNQALQAGGMNASALEASLGRSGQDEEAQVERGKGSSGHKRQHSAGLDGTQAGEPSNGVGDAEDGGMGNSRRAAPKTSGAVGPPSAAGSRLAQEGVHYEDGEADEEADSGFSEDDDDELDFSKMGMHAEL